MIERMILFFTRPRGFAQVMSSMSLTCRLSVVVALRLFGIMAILPMMGQVSDAYGHPPSLLIGLVISGYALSQMIFQVLWSYLSDIIGRKSAISCALLCMFLGSVIGYCADSIGMLIVARCIQGMAAMGSTAMAWMMDAISAEHRHRSFMIFGIMMGLAFLTAMAFGPWLISSYGFNGLFVCSILMTLGSGFLVYGIPNTPQQKRKGYRVNWHWVNKRYIVIIAAIAVLHATFTLLMPLFRHYFDAHVALHPRLWVVLTLISGLFAGGLARKMDQYGPRFKWIVPVFVAQCLIAYGLLTMTSFIYVSVFYVIFMLMFCLTESLLPALLSMMIDPAYRGLATGIFSACQYAGIALGGFVLGKHAFDDQPIVLIIITLSVGVLILWFLAQRYPTKNFTKPLQSYGHS